MFRRKVKEAPEPEAMVEYADGEPMVWWYGGVWGLFTSKQPFDQEAEPTGEL